MAIYTQYGRYIKAKQFKEMLLNQGSIYMVLGFGNPKWDNMVSTEDDTDEHSPQQMPIAAYDTRILTAGDIGSNQFFDNNIQQCYISQSELEKSIKDGRIVNDTNTGKLMNKYQNLVPPFPCIWHGDNTIELINGSGITQDNYEEWYIDVNSNQPLYNVKDGTFTTVNWPPGSSVAEELEKQYYSELVLRGKAIANGLIHPVGLLGAVKCTVSFVKDIGPTINNYQPNDKPYFWYGDRYWQIVETNDEDLDRYITERITSEDDPNADNSQVIYPHHLVIRAMIPPHTFCNELQYDQHLIAREIALFTKKRRSSSEALKPFYRADEYAFNFGQYYKDTSTDEWVNVPQSFEDKVLNFTLPCTIEGRKYSGDEYDFKFILNDYIRGGGIRHSHSMDLISYIIGF